MCRVSSNYTFTVCCNVFTNQQVLTNDQPEAEECSSRRAFGMKVVPVFPKQLFYLQQTSSAQGPAWVKLSVHLRGPLSIVPPFWVTV